MLACCFLGAFNEVYTASLYIHICVHMYNHLLFKKCIFNYISIYICIHILFSSLKPCDEPVDLEAAHFREKYTHTHNIHIDR